uniref:Epl101 n=1 Tax=Arundo donax TaxID=35708 RepID=A0A0A9E4Y9_ARUDO
MLLSSGLHNFWSNFNLFFLVKPPPPSSDTNPYNVFRPREKAYRLHTRRMQSRENNVQSFEKLRLVRRNLEQAKVLMEALIKREEKKRDTMECEVYLRRIHMKYKHEAQLLDDGMALSGHQQVSSQFGLSEDDYANSDDTTTEQPFVQPIAFHPRFPDNKLSVIPSIRLKQGRELKRKLQQTAWFFNRDPEEPVMLFTRPLILDKLEMAGIRPPPDPPIVSGATAPPFRRQGRIGRGGRIIFDRWNPFLQVPIGRQASQFMEFNHRPPVLEG